MIRTLIAFFVPAIAYAQEAAAPGANAAAGSPLASFLPLIVIVFVFYFLLIKPQQKRLREQQAMIAALKKGDEVVTGGGVVGRITKISDDRATVEIAKGIEVVALKATLSALSAATAPKATASKKNPAVKNDNVVPDKESVANDN